MRHKHERRNSKEYLDEISNLDSQYKPHPDFLQKLKEMMTSHNHVIFGKGKADPSFQEMEDVVEFISEEDSDKAFTKQLIKEHARNRDNKKRSGEISRTPLLDMIMSRYR